MREIFPQIQEWVDARKPFAIATVIQTWGSSPRPVGSALAVSDQQEMIGSVSGGCVEGAVVKAAAEVLDKNQPRQLRYGVSDEDAWAVGLSCGGKIQVFLEPFMGMDGEADGRKIWGELAAAKKANEGAVLLTRLDDSERVHLLVHADGRTVGSAANEALADAALEAYAQRRNTVIEQEGQSWFAEIFPPKSRLFIIGAAHITADLISFAHMFDLETIVIDPRGTFAQKTQFPEPPDQLINGWPQDVLKDVQLDAYTYAVVLSHDPKIDDQALHILLPSNVAYIGALGSSRNHAKRVKRLEEAGFNEEQIARVHGPIGLDIKAKTPREIALSVIAELIQEKNRYY